MCMLGFKYDGWLLLKTVVNLPFKWMSGYYCDHKILAKIYRNSHTQTGSTLCGRYYDTLQTYSCECHMYYTSLCPTLCNKQNCDHKIWWKILHKYGNITHIKLHKLLPSNEEEQILLNALCITEQKDTGGRKEFYTNGTHKYFPQRFLSSWMWCHVISQKFTKFPVLPWRWSKHISPKLC
jgi:hypothetical protein